MTTQGSVCPLDGAFYQDAKSLNHHMKTRHANLEKMVTCLLCPKQFKTKKDLSNHMISTAVKYLTVNNAPSLSKQRHSWRLTQSISIKTKLILVLYVAKLWKAGNRSKYIMTNARQMLHWGQTMDSFCSTQENKYKCSRVNFDKKLK